MTRDPYRAAAAHALTRELGRLLALFVVVAVATTCAMWVAERVQDVNDQPSIEDPRP